MLRIFTIFTICAIIVAVALAESEPRKDDDEVKVTPDLKTGASGWGGPAGYGLGYGYGRLGGFGGYGGLYGGGYGGWGWGGQSYTFRRQGYGGWGWGGLGYGYGGIIG